MKMKEEGERKARDRVWFGLKRAF